MSKQKKAFAIINPATGQQSVRWLIRRLEQRARRRGIEFDYKVTERPEHATELARECCEQEMDIIIAVGGDGTVSEVVTGTIGTDIAVGIVPTGSTNMIAKDLGIPRRLTPAIDVALGNGTPKPYDVGKIGETTFMHMAGAGYDAQIMHEASSVWKRRIGWPAYLWPAIKHLRSTSFRVEIEIDGKAQSTDARMVLCAIGGSIVHPRFSVGRGIDRTDGMLDVCIYNPPNAVMAVSALGWILLRKPDRSRWQRQYRGKQVILRSDQSVVFEADGNPLGELPVIIEMLDSPAHIITPG
jgi:diacylglycerol kinase (ATP)